MEKLIIFGNGFSAEVVAKIVLDSKNYEIICFTVDKKYIKQKKIFGIPVIDFETVKKKYKKKDCSIFIATGYSNMNKIREKIFKNIKKIGFKIVSIIHPKAILPQDFKYGKNCLIMNSVNIHPLVKIGNNNFLWPGSIISHHVKVGNNCWFTSGSAVAGNTHIGNNCFFGINSTITNNLRINDYSFVGARALVSKNLKKKSVVISPEDLKHKLDSLQFTNFLSNNF
ncbi:acetyltransferase [Candidatus Pelagibacter sp. HIMB1509]|uniref:acetyltransferase n=1 Tax=Candidatus Pelagibacter sp. HIMB1509 TaxID=3413339 RepID=UPI003F87CBE8